MLALNDVNTVPPGGYRFYISETNTWFAGSSVHGLCQSVARHRSANGLPGISEDALSDLIQDQLCRQLPPGICFDRQRGKIAPSLTLSAVKQGTKTIVDWWLHGKQKVDKAQANERARICATCYANVPPDDCTTCSQSVLREISEAVVNGEETDYDGYLKACAICSCQLRAKVWLPLDILKRNMPSEQRARLPSHCWLADAPVQPPPLPPRVSTPCKTCGKK